MASHYQVRTDCFVPIAMIQEFKKLLNRLSPENLHMDGEATPDQVTLERVRIHQAWLLLEKRLGFTVSVEEAEKLGR